jgi:branched-chain amino acid transport system substrate-binding protein
VWSSRTRAQAQETIKVGGIYDLSGPLQEFGRNQLRCGEMAIEEVNAKGGLLGRKIEFKSYDTQSQMQLYGQFANQLALRDRVAVVQGCLTSASREAVRPILKRANTLYIYNTPYEGGVCDRNMFSTGNTPGQMTEKMLPIAMKKHGRKLYVLAADYNYGQISTKWVEKIARDNGGEVIAKEFFPLDVNQFGATIAKIQQAKPDIVLNIFVGPSHAAFYGQWASAGMARRIPMLSTTFGATGEHLRMPTELTDGIMCCFAYFEELDTPENKAWLQRFRAKHGTDYGYINDVGMNEYYGWSLWAEGVRKAGSTDRMKVIEALESGITVNGPAGPSTVEPVTHHCIFNMYVAEMKNRSFVIQTKFEKVPPTNTGGQCDLKENPNANEQFEPKI